VDHVSVVIACRNLDVAVKVDRTRREMLRPEDPDLRLRCRPSPLLKTQEAHADPRRSSMPTRL